MAQLLVVTGSEIYDGLRLAEGPVDGYMPEQGGGIGIWDTHTNEAPNTLFALGADGWAALGGATVAQDASQTDNPFPSHAALRVDTTVAGNGADLAPAYRSPSVGNGLTFSCWMKGTAGQKVKITLTQWTIGGGVWQAFAGPDVTLTGQWQRITYSTNPGLGPALLVSCGVAPSAGFDAQTYWITAPMFAQAYIDFPYVANSSPLAGDTATRPGGRIQAPVSLMDTREGWVAARIEYGASSTIGVAGTPYLFSWQDADPSNQIAASLEPATNSWSTDRSTDTAGGTVDSPPQVFTPGAVATVASMFANTQLLVSVDGATPDTVADTTAPRIYTDLFDIGSSNGVDGTHLNGNVKWVATGKGALTDADLAYLAGVDDYLPAMSGLSPTAGLAGMMGAQDLRYATLPRAAMISAVPRAAYLVESAWGQESKGLFRFGISRFGGADVLAASAWSALFDGPFDDLSSVARDIGIQRGRDNDITQFRAGQLDLGLRDAKGIYNPYNSSSPLVMAGNLDTDKPIRVSANIDGSKYPLIYAFISDIEGDPSGRGSAHITAVDFLDKLERQNPILTGLAGGMTDGQLIGLILDWYQWQDPTMRNLAVGDTINAAYTRADGNLNGLALVAELMEAERGLAFVAASGAVTYIDRNSRYSATSLATITKKLKAFPVGKSNSNVTNSWTVQRILMDGTPVGYPQTASDQTSDHAHGTISQTITTPFLNSDLQAMSLAQYLLNRTRSGVSLVYDVPLSIADTDTLIQAVTRDIGDRVTLTIEPRNMPAKTGDFYIEAITHAITAQPSGSRHATTWRVSECPAGRAFRFGISKIGGPDWLAY